MYYIDHMVSYVIKPEVKCKCIGVFLLDLHVLHRSHG